MPSQPITVDISGALEKFRKAKVNISSAMPKLLILLASKGERYMKRISPIDTGNLRGSIHAEPRLKDAIIATSANYARYVNDGTRPHDIYPKHKKALAFPPSGSRPGVRGGMKVGITASGGVVGRIVVKHVRHPGTKGKHFVEDTYEHLSNIIVPETRKVIESELRGMNQ